MKATPALEPDISLRVATREDLPCLSTLATQVFLDTYATEGINSWFAREVAAHLSVPALSVPFDDADTTFIVAQRGGNLVGFAQLRAGSMHELIQPHPAVEIDRLYVQAPFAARGIGTRLLQESEAISAAAGARAIWLTAWVGNPRALRFYAGRGYSDLGATHYTFDGESFENRLFAKALPASPCA